MVCQAPKASAFSSFSSLDEVMMTRAPSRVAKESAIMETPPVPRSSTVSPALTRPCSTTLFHAVSAAQGRVAASAKERWEGVCTSPCSFSTTRSASMPSRGPPSALAMAAGVISPSTQR